jgi:hypothetical protein
VCTEVGTALRAVAADFFFNFGVRRSLRITVFGTYQDASNNIGIANRNQLTLGYSNRGHFLWGSCREAMQRCPAAVVK